MVRQDLQDIRWNDYMKWQQLHTCRLCTNHNITFNKAVHTTAAHCDSRNVCNNYCCQHFVNTWSKMVARWVLPLSHFAKSLCNSHNLGILHSSRLLSQPPQPLIMLPVPHLSLSISATHHQYCQCVEWHISQALSEYFDLHTCDCVAGFIHTKKVTCTQGILV